MLPATRVDPVVFRGLLRVFHMLEPPERLARDPELVLRSLPMLARVLVGQGPEAPFAARRARGGAGADGVVAPARATPAYTRACATSASKSRIGRGSLRASSSGCHCTPITNGWCSRLDRLDHAVLAPADRRAARRRDAPPPGDAPTAPTSSVPSRSAASRLPRVESDAVRHGLQLRRAVHHAVAEVIRDVRDQVAAERHVQELHAAADAQDRQLGRARAARASVSSKRSRSCEMP